MTANTNPIFPLTGVLGIAHITTANTNRDGTGTIADLTAVAGADGLRINEIVAKAEGTTTAGMIRIFLNDGSNWRLYDEIPVAAATPSATVETWRDFIQPRVPFIVPSGFKLGCTTHNSETFNVFAIGGNY